jgi:hypothetical protein
MRSGVGVGFGIHTNGTHTHTADTTAEAGGGHQLQLRHRGRVTATGLYGDIGSPTIDAHARLFRGSGGGGVGGGGGGGVTPSAAAAASSVEGEAGKISIFRQPPVKRRAMCAQLCGMLFGYGYSQGQ